MKFLFAEFCIANVIKRLPHPHTPSIFYPLRSMYGPFFNKKLLIVIKLQIEENIDIFYVICLATSLSSGQRIINNQFNTTFV